jgi:hypothetical protein
MGSRLAFSPQSAAEEEPSSSDGPQLQPEPEPHVQEKEDLPQKWREGVEPSRAEPNHQASQPASQPGARVREGERHSLAGPKASSSKQGSKEGGREGGTDPTRPDPTCFLRESSCAANSSSSSRQRS